MLKAAMDAREITDPDMLSIAQRVLHKAGIPHTKVYETDSADAVIRRLEIIGEAMKNISQTTRAAYSNIPWKVMAGMRDILIHEYFGVDLEEVWYTCINDLPELKRQIQQILNDNTHS